MREKEEHLYYCKETEQVFRHPVLTSDGHTFELIFLIDHVSKHGLYSPETNEKIYYIEYNLQLKNAIDVDCPENRYPDYERLELFQQLQMSFPLFFRFLVKLVCLRLTNNEESRFELWIRKKKIYFASVRLP